MVFDLFIFSKPECVCKKQYPERENKAFKVSAKAK